MRPRAGFAMLMSIGCAGVCMIAVAHFVFRLFNNQLSWAPTSAVRDHYTAVGHYYVQGFIVGFFLCFSLAVAAVAAANWIEHKRATHRPASAPTLHRIKRSA